MRCTPMVRWAISSSSAGIGSNPIRFSFLAVFLRALCVLCGSGFELFKPRRNHTHRAQTEARNDRPADPAFSPCDSAANQRQPGGDLRAIEAIAAGSAE